MVLDARPGGIIYKSLVPEYVNYVRTIYEGLFNLYVCQAFNFIIWM